jgi:hypothetical protein
VATVDDSVPIIYTRTSPLHEPRLRPLGRGVAMVVAMACLSILVLAAKLPPSPSGVGSHRALGLQSCNFLETTGLPCPSCGMTTSFSWFVRGNLLASFYVQPMGAAVAAITACCVWGGLYVAATGRPAYRLLRLVPARYYLLPLLTLGVLAWAWKVAIHVNGLDGWR